jgi:hypothetical protein
MKRNRFPMPAPTPTMSSLPIIVVHWLQWMNLLLVVCLLRVWMRV